MCHQPAWSRQYLTEIHFPGSQQLFWPEETVWELWRDFKYIGPLKSYKDHFEHQEKNLKVNYTHNEDSFSELGA